MQLGRTHRQIGRSVGCAVPALHTVGLFGSLHLEAVELDTLEEGRRVRLLAVVDDFTRACLAIEVDTSIGGRRVVAVLQRLVDSV